MYETTSAKKPVQTSSLKKLLIDSTIWLGCRELAF